MYTNDFVLHHMNELSSRVVAESGIPSDRYHLGKLIFQALKDSPDFVAQIDGATRQAETCQSLAERSAKCAMAYRNMGLTRGDVVVLMAPNHLEVAVAFYATLYEGLIVAPVDRTLNIQDIRHMFNITQPKLILCQSNKAPDVQVVLNELTMDTQIVTFDTGDYLCSFEEFIKKYTTEEDNYQNYRPVDFDTEKELAFLITTSGTTGLPKCVAATQKNFAISCPYAWSKFSHFPTPTRMFLTVSPLQWLTAIIMFLNTPIVKVTRLQTSEELTVDHFYYLTNTFKPTFTILSPPMMTTFIKPDLREQCDFNCYEVIMLGGSAVPPKLVDEVKEIMPRVHVFNVFGMSELAGLGFQPEHIPRAVGRPIGSLEYRIVDTGTEEEILEPNVPGELWIRGPSVIREYYNNPEATQEAFSEGHWFKTGDLFYKDENMNYFYVERIKMLIKYKGNQISPVEIENVIRQHPGVLEAAITSISDTECGELPVAVVVLKTGHVISAQEIKDLVKGSLSDYKQLRGGVVFVTELPMTASGKLHRRKIKEIASEIQRE